MLGDVTHSRFLNKSAEHSQNALPSLTAHVEQISILATEVASYSFDTKLSKAQRSRSISPQYWFVVTDLIAIAFSLVASMMLAIAVNTIMFGRDVPWVSNDAGLEHLTQYGFIATGLILWFENSGHYRRRMPFWMEIQKSVNACALSLMADVLLQFTMKHDFSRLWLVSAWVFTAMTIPLGRSIARYVLDKKGLWKINTLLVGRGTLAKDATTTIRNESSLGYNLVGQLSHPPAELEHVVLHWRTVCHRYNANYVMLAMDGTDAAGTDNAIAQLQREGVAFSVFSPLRHMPAQNISVHYFFSQRAHMVICDNLLEQLLPCAMKRGFDIIAASLALVMLSPLLVLLALVTASDGGPVFFAHKRIGRNGKSFQCLKFRSMIIDAAAVLKKHLADNPPARAEWDKDHKLKDDPRTTRFGSLMRRLSIDELPQLLNVLRGDMSLVGPRPIVIAEASRYDSDISHYYRVRPGVTGLWQVSGRNDVSYSERVQMDAWYVRNWSLWLDIAIICKTVPALLARRGAY